mmetsp:Transcript_46422/g.83829  ORF Transcript_46422/g.83829 Transcript_46422/m.83829 type:complete len:210 (+) Transcript_46422:20-649(+)
MVLCTLTSCADDGTLGGFATGVVWLSHIFLGFAAFMYTFSFMLIMDGASNVAQFHGIDDVLKDAGILDKAAAYEALKTCENPAVKHMAFWLMHLQRTWGVFQTALSAALWTTVFALPVQHRAAAHLILSYLQITAGLLEASLVWGCPLPDMVVKFGGFPAGSVSPEPDSQAWEHKPFPRPNNAGVKGNIYLHLVLGILNIIVGILTFFV